MEKGQKDCADRVAESRVGGSDGGGRRLTPQPDSSSAKRVVRNDTWGGFDGGNASPTREPDSSSAKRVVRNDTGGAFDGGNASPTREPDSSSAMWGVHFAPYHHPATTNPGPRTCHSEAKRGIWANRGPMSANDPQYCVYFTASLAKALYVRVANNLNRQVRVYERDHDAWASPMAQQDA
jgi:hypothetical protein